MAPAVDALDGADRSVPPEQQVRRLEALVERRTRELEILSSVAERIHAAEDAQQVLDICLAEILRGPRAQRGVGPARVAAGPQAGAGGRPRGLGTYLEEIRRDGLGECLCREVFSAGQSMQARNTTECPRMPAIVDGLAAPVAHACVPLRMHGASVRGVLNVAARPHEQFGDDELRFLETLGHQLCVAIERAEHRQAEQARSVENARLYEDARRAYDELKDAQQRLLQNERMALLGTFASGLAHEVRNPLNSIALQLSLLERRIAGAEPRLREQLAELAGVIREEIRRLDALVGDFLLFSRTSRIQLQPTDLDALVDEVTRLLRPEARGAGVTLRRKRVGRPGAEPRRRPREAQAGRDQPGAQRHRGDAGRRRGRARERAARRPRRRRGARQRPGAPGAGRHLPAVRHHQAQGDRPGPVDRAADRARARRRDRGVERARRGRDLHDHAAARARAGQRGDGEA